MTAFLVNWAAATPAFAVPFLFAALGLILSERAGVLFLGVEGFMLIGALAGAATILTLGPYPIVALVVSMLASSLVAILFAGLVVGLRVNQVLAGLAMVFFAGGLTALLGATFGWTNVAFSGLPKLSFGPLSDLPVVGRILFRQDLVVYLAIPAVIAVQYLLTRTMFGLKLRAVGENPQAADSAGVAVQGIRFAAVLMAAALIGLAGGYLSVGTSKIFVDGMSAGRGWIAIALVIFARWQPWRALGGALLFGGIEALVPRISAVGIQVPQYFMLMTPYLITLAVMVWIAVKKHGAFGTPAALGVPHVREERR